ncbi:zinc finger protein 91 isoform X1 [Pleuronectes platessa]|uniref:zinc finger protein 91 isoform X1 n=1 Tax=Pleuronectes platessa TaxID=8262 RepID=UPI00232A1630|nr:zinc finger protein 91 isoform X1 [Pleuronectes platessa]
MEVNSKGERSCPTLSALRLLVSPLRLVSAAVWQTIQKKVVANYGMLEEFVSTVTDIVPELLTTRQKFQLTLGLRARLILELCQFEATADFAAVWPHLDRMQNHIEAWLVEAGATNEEVPNSDFVDVVKNILKDPEKRGDFFQNVFPEKFGATFDEALHTLTWLLLSRLEKLLPLQPFQQVSSMFDEASPVLEDCLESVAQYEELRIVLRYQKDLSQLDHNDGSLDGACITSALKLPSAKITETQKKAQANILDYVLTGTSDVDEEHLAPPHTAQLNTDSFTEHPTSEIKTEKTNWTPGENETGLASDDITRREENVDQLQSQADDAAGVKQCCVQLERRDTPQSWQLRPVRRNRGLKLKQILLKEKRGLCDQALPVCKRSSRKAKSPSRTPQGVSDDESSIHSSYMAPITNCSEDDSGSYYSDEDSFHKTTSGSPSMADSYRKLDSDVKASTSKKVHQVYCFLCKEHVDTSLRSHMTTHFPEGDYACPRCDSRFKLFSSFEMHMRRTCYEYGKQQVDPEKPDEAQNLYKCDKCQEAFRFKVSLDRHRLTHDELYCSVCRKVLRDAATLARHKVSHTAFQCTRCEETFTLFKPLVRHCENIHKISRPFKCNRCPKTLTRLRFLILHEWTHTGHLPFQCARCSCRFKSDADLIYHERVHTKEKPFRCPECGKTFSQKSNLLRHLNLIHDERQKKKRHACSQCEKSFKEKEALKKHQRSKHLNELFRHPFSYCGKMLSTSTLARHKLIQTGERPFKCTVPECDKLFRSTSEVKKHVLIQHTTERPYKCDVRGKGDVTRREENVSHLQSQADDAAGVKQCCVQLERRDLPQSLQLRPVRRNRGLKLKQILLKEKRGLCDQALPVCKPSSRKAKSPSRAPQGVSDDESSIRSSYMAPITNCSEDDSGSYYSDEDSFHKTTSGSPSMADSYRKLDSDVKASTSKKVHQVYCFLCKKHVDTSLRSHMTTHFPEGDYACPRCDSRFKLFSSFEMHMRRTCYEYGKQQVDPEKPDEAQNLYKCDKCQEAFRFKVSLDRHRLTHDELYCSVCRKVLRDAATLARHKVSHTAFQCTRCEETFTLFKPLVRHCENIHKISRPFKCNRCPKTLPRLRFLILHEWTHTGHLPFQCARCSCRFKSDADLIYHERVHTKEKPFRCPECGKTFSQKSNLLRHLNLIHDERQKKKRHACSQCEKSFKEKEALKKHQRSKHLNELFRHPCSYCGKMLSTSTLARHKLIHTGERPFKCTVPECDKLFRSTSEVKKHVLIQHTTERPYKCDVRGKGDVTRREENVSHLQSQADDASGVKQCCVQLERRDTPQSLQLRPVRRNRGLKLKQILLKEKRGLCDQALPVCKPSSRKAKSPSRTPQGVSDDESSIHSSYMAPITNCSEDDSGSYYSDEDSFHKTTSGSPSMADSYRKVDSDVKASTSKKVHQVYCFLCKKHIDTSLRSHMKTHFPEGDYACPGCDSRFKLFSSLKMHVLRTCYEYGKQQVDPEKPDEAQNLYKCDKCKEAFRFKVSLDRHRLTHDELYCSVCRKVLRDTATLARHKVSHTAFQCTRCEETFTLFMPLLRHCENVHKISRPFKCNRCPKTLTRLRFLILHEWTHTGHLPFQCARCSCRFKSDSDLVYHERVHTKEKPFLCPECGKTFSLNSNLLRHLNVIHDERQKKKRHACSQCEKSFKEKGALKKHQRSKHLNELFRHPCSYCGKMLSTSTLARHKLIHTGERPFKCTVPECDKLFRSTSEVKKHVLIQHTTERPYKCDVCGKGFIKMCFLKAHAKIHSEEKPFVCHICGKAFPKLYSMQRHKKLIHTIVPH